MYLAYLDESGSTGRRLDDPDQPVLWMVAVLVPEDAIQPLEASLDAIVAHHLPESPLVEVHAQELFSGEGPWKQIEPAVRVAVMRETLGLLVAHDCAVIHSSIHKTRLASKNYDQTSAPQLLAQQFLVEKIDGYVMGLRDPLRSRVLLIADKSNKTENSAKEMIGRLQRSTYGEVPGKQLQTVIGTPHFVRSDESRGIQLADTVAYVLNKHDRLSAQQEGDRASLLFGEFRGVVKSATVGWRQCWPSA